MTHTIYNTIYPFFVLSAHGLTRLDFEPITILYGGNGSGKTTALNIIAEKLSIARESLFNHSEFFSDYVRLCDFRLAATIPGTSKIITSDDVFDYNLNIRSLNEGIDVKRDELMREYVDYRYSQFVMRSLDDYEELRKSILAKKKQWNQSAFVRGNVMGNLREQSNGESAFLHFTDKIREAGLYLLDEPENSLSPERQLELLKYLEDSARFYDCQFIIATHSPFLLSLRGAKIYDFDEEVVDVKRWTQLKNVRLYYDFFKKHAADFKS